MDRPWAGYKGLVGRTVGAAKGLVGAVLAKDQVEGPQVCGWAVRYGATCLQQISGNRVTKLQQIGTQQNLNLKGMIRKQIFKIAPGPKWQRSSGPVFVTPHFPPSPCKCKGKGGRSPLLLRAEFAHSVL